MKKLTIALSLLTAATLSACGSEQYHRTASTDSTVYVSATRNNLRAGPGKIVDLLDPNGPVNGISWQRMTLKMEDGSFQIIDRRGQQLAMGSEVVVR
jgi:hypothetical protein